MSHDRANWDDRITSLLLDLVAKQKELIYPGLRASDHHIKGIIQPTLLKRNKSGSLSGFTRIIHHTTMSPICVQNRFALEHQILHTDIECISEKQDEIYYTISTNLSANQFYRFFKCVDPIAIGLVIMQALS